MRGAVKFYDMVRGFGFIIPADGSEDVFFHTSGIAENAKVRENDMVSFDVVPGRGGRPKAINVRIAD
jgi:CspA family cold shock protein